LSGGQPLTIVTEYPFWFIIFCILAGVLVSGILYYKNSKENFSPSLRKLLALMRFLSVTSIAFLLLTPMLKTLQRNYEKPLLILAQDNSESIVNGKDSSYYTGEFATRLNALAEKLSSEYDVHTYHFSDKTGENFDFSYSGKQTDISGFFAEIITRYSNRNVGSMLLATDGLFNKGINPVYSSEKIRFPVYTLALGDTSMHKDLYLRHVNFNRIAFKGNKFPVEIVIGANMASGQSSTLTVSSGGITLFSQTVAFSSDQFTETVRVLLNAEKDGLQRYHINVKPLSEEISLENNSQDIFIDVLDTKQKILILSQSPHPDIAALKSALESNFTNEVTEMLISRFTGNISAYNLIVLHQLPGGSSNISNLVDEAAEQEIPILYILGTQSGITQFNALNTGLQILTDKQIYNEALPAINPEFSLFTISDETRKAIENFPPLTAPFGEFKTLMSTTTLFNQQIGSLVTAYPLVVFTQTLNGKTGIIAGEGIWRWRMVNYQKNGNHNAFDELFSKMTQYLSVKADRSRFRVTGKNNFQENEMVTFDAEVYNESYELITEPEVEITITNSTGDSYPFVFSKTNTSYHLNAGILPVDNYSYKATVRVGEKLLNYQGEFTVSPLNIESLNTIADHHLLFRLAARHDGQMLYPADMEHFAEILKARDDIKTVVFTEQRFSELVNLFWVFVIILALLTIEWFIRKINGSY